MRAEHSVRHRHLMIFLSFALIILLTAACQPQPVKPSQNEGAVLVTVSILPQAYFVERIGGDAVRVNVMVGPGEEAHTYEPKPEQMKALSLSPVFFSIGVEYEDTWIPRFADVNPEMVFVNSAASIIRIEAPDAHTHSDTADQDDQTDESSESVLHADPHVWLAPENGKIIAANIRDALITLAPEKSALFEENFESLIMDIDALDARINATLAGKSQRSFMVFHPAWGYFAYQYDLEQIPVQVGGQEPSVSEMAELVQIARKEQIKVIFIQPTFSTANAQAIADEIGAKVAIVDPLARDWLDNLATVAETFAAALRD